MESTEYREGREAYSDDKHLEDNPYKKTDPTRAADWAAGWNYAMHNDPLAPELF